MATYEPKSHDAMFARIMEHLDYQDKDSDTHRKAVISRLDLIQTAVDKTNGRVTKLEREKWHNRGFVAALGLGVTCAWEWLTRK